MMRFDRGALVILLAATGVAIAETGRPVVRTGPSLWEIQPARVMPPADAIYPPVATPRRPLSRTGRRRSLWEEPWPSATVHPQPVPATWLSRVPVRSVPERVRPAPACYRALVERHAARFDLPPELVLAVMQVESSFRVDAVSPQNARGLMQLVPSRGGHEALRYVTGDPRRGPPTPAQLADPDTNVLLGTAYLRFILDTHIPAHLPWPVRRDLALAAYNWGPDRVVRRLIGSEPPRSEDDLLARLDSWAPSETRQYVRKIRRLLARRPPIRPAPLT